MANRVKAKTKKRPAKTRSRVIAFDPRRTIHITRMPSTLKPDITLYALTCCYAVYPTRLVALKAAKALAVEVGADTIVESYDKKRAR